MELQGNQNSQNNLEKEEQSWRTLISNFKSCYKTTVFQIIWYWYKDRHIGQKNRIESPEKKYHIYGQLIFSFFKRINFIYLLFLVVLRLCCCTQAFSICGAQASHCGGFSCFSFFFKKTSLLEYNCFTVVC